MYLLLFNDGVTRRFLYELTLAGSDCIFGPDPTKAYAFKTRRLVDNFRAKHPCFAGRVVLLTSELKRAAQ